MAEAGAVFRALREDHSGAQSREVFPRMEEGRWAIHPLPGDVVELSRLGGRTVRTPGDGGGSRLLPSPGV